MKEGKVQAPSELSDKQFRNIFDVVNDGLIIYELTSGAVVEANPAACKMHGYTREEFVGKPLGIFIHRKNKRIFNDVRALESGGVFDTRIRHIRQDGSTFYAEWCITLFDYRGHACLLGVVRDISKRIQEEQSLSTHIHEQATLLDISHTLASTLEIQPELILDQLHEIIEYHHAGLFYLKDSKLITLAMRGTPQLEQSIPIQIELKDLETLKRLFNKHLPIRIVDVWSDNPQAQFLRSLLDDGAAVLLEDMQSWMWVPLAVKDRIIGGIGIAHKKRNHFTAHHADLAQSVANQAAITMINAELYEQAQALAVLEERQSLARNLHDAVNQSLFSAGLIAEILPRLWERDQAEARKSLNDLRRLTHGAMAEMRSLLAELRPTALTDSNLGELLESLGKSFSGRTNIALVIKVNHEIILPSKVQLAFYRVCQEALFNITKHAKASEVEINLSRKGAMIKLSIRDNGQGFNTQQTFSSGHYGLSMMRERAETVGAVLAIVSTAGSGTTLTMSWKDVQKKESP